MGARIWVSKMKLKELRVTKPEIRQIWILNLVQGERGNLIRKVVNETYQMTREHYEKVTMPKTNVDILKSLYSDNI